MKRTIYTYKEYPDYPDATATSRTCNFINWFICLLGFIAAIFALIDGDIILGLIIIGGVVLISFLIKKIENLLISSIIKGTPSLSSQYVSEQELIIAKAKQRKAQYFLEIGTFCKEFREEAQKHNMSEKEYKHYCKKCVEEYNEVYRRYNLTHTEKVPY